MVINRVAAIITVSALAALNLQAQDYPQDAKSLLRYHFSTTENVATNRAYVYLYSGAGMQLREVLGNKSELNPDDFRFLLQAACWDVSMHPQALSDANDWLSLYADDQPSAAVNQVDEIVNYLEKSKASTAEVQEAIVMSRWLMIAVLIAFVSCIHWFNKKYVRAA